MKTLHPKLIQYLKLARDIAIMALLIFGARSAIADWNHVPTGSMKPTIVEGDLIFVDRLAYDLKFPFTTWHLAKWDNPARGEIVVFYSPANGDRLVKRIIGVPGDIVAMHQNRLYLNGQPLTYEKLERKFVDGLDADSRYHYRFAEENLQGTRHPVMALKGDTPGNSFGPVTVPESKYLVLGDNRDNSADSRYFGFVDRNAIVGRATAVIASWNAEHFYLPRKDRFFLSLP
jgi:signal peptidase I